MAQPIDLSKLEGGCLPFSTLRLAADSLGEIGTGNETAIEALANLLESTQDEDTRGRAAESLGKIDP